MPALEYGLGLWGAGRSFTSGAWKQIEVFWRTAARTILKAPLRTPSEALLSDLGWSKFWTRGAWQAVCLWSRVTRMGEDELARKAMYMQREMLRQNKECWLSTLRSTLVATAAGQEMWDKWWISPNFSVLCVRTVLNEHGEPISVKWSDIMKETFQRASCMGGMFG